MPQVIEQDTENNFSWAQRVSVFDDAGFLVSRQTTFDDGRVRDETLDNGVTIRTDWTDPNDAMLWASRSVNKDAATGRFSTKTVTRDDGRTITTTFTDNVRSSQVIVDEGNNFNFASRTKLFDSAGRLSSVQVTYDDGRTALTSYVDGVRTDRTVTDTDNAHGWSTRLFDYDDITGKLISTTTTYDSGQIVTKLAPTGPISETVVRQDDQGRFAWDTITTNYDGSGYVATKLVTYDNGVVRNTEYDQGQRSSETAQDTGDAHSWATQDKTFDAAGRLAQEVRTMDDGRVITKGFTAGIATSRTEVDLADAHNWDRREWTFDEAGLRASVVTDFDNGIQQTLTYSQGIIASRTQLDLQDARSWQSIETVYDDRGVLLYRAITNDAGDTRYIDARKLDVVTGGTVGQLSEDAGPTLDTSGQIEMAAGYRGSTSFTPHAQVAGSAGLGVFTLNADGTWSYSAANNQAAIQMLDAGESLTDSFTAVTTDGVETTVTVTIDGADDSAAPLYVGGEVVTLGTAGNRGTSATPFDLATLFHDDMGDALSITIDSVPAGYTFENGLLSAPELSESGTLSFQANVTATDSDGQSTTELVSFAYGLAQDYGLEFGAHSDVELISTNQDDWLTFGDRTSYQGSAFYLDTGTGDDQVTFGSGAFLSFTSDRGPARIDLGTGRDTLVFGEFAAYNDAASNSAVVDIRADDGVGDVFSFGNNAANAGVAANGGLIMLSSSRGDDIITFGSDAGIGGRIDLDASLGADQITIGTGAQNFGINLGVNDGDADTLTFLGSVKSTSIFSWEAGVDAITFSAATGSWTAVDAGSHKVFTGNDGQSLTVFGAAGVAASDIVSGLTYAPIYVGLGDTTDSIGNHYYDIGLAGSGAQAATFDLSTLFSDVDAAVGGSLTISVDTLPAGLSLTEGVLSVLHDSDAQDYTAAGDHTVRVTATDASGASVTQQITLTVALDHDFTGHDFGPFEQQTLIEGSSAADRAIFDQNPAVFSSMSVLLGAGEDQLIFGERGGVSATLTLDTGADADTITFDAFAAVTGNVSLSTGSGDDTIALGDHAATASGVLTVNADEGDDTLSFGINAGVTNGSVQVDMSAGDDVVTFGAGAGYDNGMIEVNLGAGDDTIIFAENAGFAPGSETGQVHVDGGTGEDNITFGARATNVTIDLGASDGAADMVTFEGSMHNTAINDWVQGEDTIVLASDTGVWHAWDAAGDKVFASNDGQRFTVSGAGGLAPSDIVADVNLSPAPIYVGEDFLTIGATGNQAGGSNFFRVSGLFSSEGGGSTTITSPNLPAPMSIGGNILRGWANSDPDPSNWGEFDVTLTATDASDQSTSQDATLSLALKHNFGYYFGTPTAQTIDGSESDDLIIFEVGARNVDVASGGGDDVISFGAGAGASGAVSVDGGAGEDQITFGRSSQNLTIDLGTGDGAADTVTFEGRLRNTTINGWKQGEDSIVFAEPSGFWTAADEGGDKVFYNRPGSPIFTVTGAAGIEATEIVSNFIYNEYPTYIGTPDFTDQISSYDYFLVGSTGSGTQFSALDLNTLFTDADLAEGESLMITVDSYPYSEGLSISDGLVSVIQGGTEPSYTDAGDYFFQARAIDPLGAQTTKLIALTVALDHDFTGHDFGPFDQQTIIEGSSAADRAIFDQYPAVFSSMSVTLGAGADSLIFADRGGVQSTLTLDTGTGDDTIEFGDFAAVQGNVSISSEEGNDEITFRNHAATDSGTISITDLSGDNMIDFGVNAGVTNGTVNVTLGEGADQISFGINAGFDSGEINVETGAGADQITFGDAARNLAIDFGEADGARDVLIFLGTAENAEVSNFELGTDGVDVLDPSNWIVTSDPLSDPNTVLSDGVSDITFIGITGETTVDEFLF